jgi:hypothetical protein
MMNEHGNSQPLNWDERSTPTHWSLKSGPIINEHNRGVYLNVGWMLGSVSIISLIGIVALAFYGKEIPQALVALGSVAVGALGSLFTHK